MRYLIIMPILSILALQGCVTTSGSPFTIKTSGNFLGSSEGSLNVVSFAMQKEVRGYISSAQAEELGQKILTDKQDYEFTTWNDANLGEMRMAPTSTFVKDGRKCRGYRVDYWFTGSLRVRRHVPAVACMSTDGRWVATN